MGSGGGTSTSSTSSTTSTGSTTTSSSSTSTSGAPSCDVDGGIDTGGCYDTGSTTLMCVAATNSELLNQCAAGCSPFNNAARLKNWDGGALPQLPMPGPDGGMLKPQRHRPVDTRSPPLAFAAVSLLATRARAVQDCTQLPNPVYAGGSTAIEPVMATIATYLAVQSPPVTLVYAPSGSCSGVATVVGTVAFPPTPLFTPAGKSNYFNYWTATGTELTCDIAAPMLDGGTPVCGQNVACIDVGLSDVFPETCQSFPSGLPGGLVDHQGPVQAMTFVVPSSSDQS